MKGRVALFVIAAQVIALALPVLAEAGFKHP